MNVSRAAASSFALISAILLCARPARGQDIDTCIAAAESALSLRKAGKLIEARRPLATCSASSCPDPVRSTCQQRLAEVNKAVASIVLQTKDAAGNDVVGVKVAMDGQALASGPPGAALEVDPGEHTFTFEARGLPTIERKVVVAGGVKQQREVVVFAAREEDAAHESVGAGTSPPLLSLVAFGVGGAGLALGVVGGLVAGSKHSTLSSECDNAAGTCAPEHGDDLDAFHTWRTVSTVGYVVGGLGVASGALLWLTAPKARNGTATTAHVWLGPASAGVAGSF